MGQGWFAFREGIRRAARFWQLLVVFYGVSLIATLPLFVLPAFYLAQSARRPSIQQAADGIDAWLVFESLLERVRQIALSDNVPTGPDITGGVISILSYGLLAAVAAPFLAWIGSAFLSGGVLLVYSEAPRSFQWRRFFWGCWRWFGVFLLLGFLQALLTASVLVFFGVLGILLASFAWGLVFPVIVLLSLVLVFGLAFFEMARLAAVSGNTRNLWQAFRDGLRFLRYQAKSLAGLYLLALGLLAAIHGGFRLWLLDIVPLPWWPLALASQQVFILLRLWARGVRLAGAAALRNATRL